MDVSTTRKVSLLYRLTGLFFVFILILIPFRLWSQTAVPLNCDGNIQSWIARWTISSFSGPFRPANMVDGSKVNFNKISSPGPWKFNVNFGIVRHLSGIKLYSGSGLNSPRTYEILVSTDSLLFTSVKKDILPYEPGVYEHLIDFNGYFEAKYVRIVFTDAYVDETTFSPNQIQLWEVNFLQCGVDPITTKMALSGSAIAPTVACADAITQNIHGVINTYFSGQVDAIKDSKTIKADIRKARGSNHTLVWGDRILIIQMQNALISDTNSMAYGNGNDLTASGWTDVQNTGEYEFGIVESVSGDIIQLAQPLQKSYSADNVFQVVYSPVYDNVTISDTIKAVDWDGYCGGIVTFDAKIIHLNNQTIDVSAQGFRKGKMTSSSIIKYFWGIYCTDNDWYCSSKGEGIAGAPRGSYPVESKRPYSAEDLNLKIGGSLGRGAPGNAGGGGMDHNSGGGGGANIGSGGQGGASWGGEFSGDMTIYWSTTSPDGSMDGKGYYPNGGMGGTGMDKADPFRIWMGGAGGNGFQIDKHGTAGGNGGGIILATARVVLENGYFKANGNSSDHSTNDGAGGGGAGGTIVFGFDDQSGATIHYSAKGGNGGNVNFDFPRGPGGGGGGGAIIVSATSTDMNIKGGRNGINTGTLSQWGANNGMDGDYLVSDNLKVLYTTSCDHADDPRSFGLYVPNAFLPDNTESLPRTFLPVGQGIKEYTLMIFDLWGNLIWSNSELDLLGQPKIGWDGKDQKSGRTMPTDTYIWRIKAVLRGNRPWKGMKMPNGSYHTEGPLTIIR